MVRLGSFAAVAALALWQAAPILAVPAAAPEPTPAPDAAEVEKRATSCTFSGSGGASSASKSKTSCSTIVLSAVAVPSGTTLDLTGLNDGTHVIFEGETTFGYAEWEGPLVSVSGTDITVTGASGAYLNGDGSRWWDGEGGSGGKTKPKFFYAHNMKSSSITGVYVQNSPVQVFSINGATDLTLTDITIDNTAGDGGSAKNTDAFDIGSSTGITITGANIANQDDCVAVNSGENIVVENSVCSGGHGLSIGSVGGRDDNTVSGVTFSNNEVKNSVNGIRIKANEGTTGEITGVTYSQITLSAISGYGILIEQNYDGGDLHGSPTSGVPITNLKVENVSGSGAVSSSGYDVVVVCGSGACSGWTWSGVTVTGGKKYASCQNVPSGIACS